MKSLVMITAALLSLVSCGHRNSGNTATGITAPEATSIDAENDSTRISIEARRLDSVKIIFSGDGVMDRFLKPEDIRALIGYVVPSVYDTAWNDTGIMVKMAAPDYTVVFSYEGQTADYDDWLMVWKESGRVKFRQKWFFLSEGSRVPLYVLLEKYRS